MQLFYGHYPSLENRFVKLVKEEHTSPSEKWLVVCASSLLIQQLQARLARELGIVANLHFTTVAGLISRLDQESPSSALPLFPQDHLRDFLIKEILKDPGLARYPVSRGFIQAVKSALRDLADSLADPDTLEEHLRSMPDYALQEDDGRFAWLIRLYRHYSQAEKSIPGYRSYQQAFEGVLEHIGTSAYLQSFSKIIVYGFYDMPGRQLELINHLKSSYPLTVFAPYVSHPAYRFAKKFFESNWLAVPGAENIEEPTPYALADAAAFLFATGGQATPNRLTRAKVPDPAGAVFYTAKEILRLHREEQIPFHQIAVVARNLSPYQEELRRVFAENCIPLNAAFNYPLTKYALGNFCLTVFSLSQQGFAREKVMSVFASPYFKHPQKECWKQALRRCAVNRDVSQWQDLLSHADPTQTEILQWVQGTSRQLEQLAQAQSWQTGTEKALCFLDALTDTDAFTGKDAEIYQTVRESISKMAAYTALRPTSQPGELIREILEVLAAFSFDEASVMPGGVSATDVVRIRGLSFHTVFILGLNDGEFPLITTEDPLLRDYYRFILRDTLGYWINASLDRIDEERLLFYIAVTTARNHLYTLTADKTADGKPAVPSLYAAELARACGQVLEPEDLPRVSGYLSERLAACPLEFLTPKELSYRFILHPATAEQHYRQAGLFTEDKAQSLTAAAAISQPGLPGLFDGFIPSGNHFFTRENKKGFSPSALQELGTCPFKYFAKRGLHLAEPEEPLSRRDLAADERGSAFHAVLRDFYTTLREQHLTPELFDSAAASYVSKSLDKIYPPGAYQRFGIYPVVWELLLEQMRQTLINFVTEDLKNLKGFIPTYFEKEITTEPTAELPLHLHGFIDRIDTNEEQHALRIVDYKSTRKGTTDLTRDFFTRLTFQPFLYWHMLLQHHSLKGYHVQEACLLTLAHYKQQVLSAEEFDAMREAAYRFLKQLADLVQHGNFFINPSDACAYCPYALLCRRDAFKPLLRARKNPPAVALEEARQ